MQFVHTPYFTGYGADASQQQQSQQQQTPSSSAAAQTDQQQHLQSPSVSQSLALSADLTAFATQQGLQLPVPGDLSVQGKQKRKQVRNACVNCQKACKKCDDERPCQRCLKYSLASTCVNSVRKERKKGVKRGPYKKRKQDGLASSGGTATSGAGATGPPALSAGIFAPGSQAADVRHNGVLAYPPFQTNSYDPFNGVSYQNSASILQNAFLVPSTMQQMYPANNSILSYHAAMSVLSPQQGPASPNIYGNYKPSDQANAQVPSAQSQTSDQQQDDAKQQDSQHGSHEASPTVKQNSQMDSDDERSKLAILSQLCSAVLHHVDPPKTNTLDDQKSTQQQMSTTPSATDVSGTTETTDSADSKQSAAPPSNNHSEELSIKSEN